MSWIQLEQKQNALLNEQQTKVECIIRFAIVNKLTVQRIGHSTNLKQNKRTNFLFFMILFKNINA